MDNNRIILHTCCAPCASACIERLLEEGMRPVLYYSNSNINSIEEYEKRLAEVNRLAAHHSLELAVDPYDHDAWLTRIKGLEGEPEKGGRCTVCFRYSLERTAAFAAGAPFTTTLTVSPHKNAPLIFGIGKELGNFAEIDFKKKNGFARSVQISKELDLYRQSYCGCEFSYRP